MNRSLRVLGLVGLVVACSVQAGGDPEAGRAKAAACAGCHGADGNSTVATFPILAGQHADYLVQALKDYKSGKRKNAIMQAQAAGLSEEDMENLAAYFASQKGLRAIDAVHSEP